MEAIESCMVHLSGFGGGQLVCTSKITVDITIDDSVIRAELLVVVDKWLENDVLLGRDILCKNDKRVVIQDNKCWVEQVASASAKAEKLSKHENDLLKQVINNHRSCFSENVSELGRCTLGKMNIELTKTTPINLKPYRVAFAQRERVLEMLRELLEAGIVRESASAYASPVVIVPKKNGEIRLCVDYRQLNLITKKIPLPMPVMEEHFALLAGNKFFSTMDLRMEYHQVELEEAVKKYTAFVTLNVHYEYNRVPFGLVNTPAVFQSIMKSFF